jgi:hypothetical protein
MWKVGCQLDPGIFNLYITLDTFLTISKGPIHNISNLLLGRFVGIFFQDKYTFVPGDQSFSGHR